MCNFIKKAQGTSEFTCKFCDIFQKLFYKRRQGDCSGYTNISDFEEVNVSWVSIYHNSQVLILKTDSFYSAFKFVDSKGSQGIL